MYNHHQALLDDAKNPKPHQGDATCEARTTMPSNRTLAGEAVIVLLTTLTFYIWSCCPTIGFGDTAIMVHAMHHGIINSHVNNHPFTVLAGWLLLQLGLPFVPAFQANLVSAVFGALTIAVLYAALRVTGVSRLAALVSVMITALSHSLWWHSTIVENYALSAFCVTATYLALLKAETQRATATSLYWIFIACTTAGLSMFNHVENGFLCIGVAVAGLCSIRRYPHPLRNLTRCAMAALLGLSPWLFLVLQDARKQGLHQALEGAFVGKFQGTFFSANLWMAVSDTTFLLWFQAPLGFMTIAGAIGVWQLLRRFSISSSVSGMVVHIALTLAVFSGYATWDRFAFCLPAFIGLFFFAGYGFWWLVSTTARSSVRALCAVWAAGSLITPAVMYPSITIWANDPDSIWHARFNNQYAANLYNQAEFITNPHKRGYREVERFATLLGEKLPTGAIFLDDDSRTYYPLADYFQNITGLRKDVQFLLVNSWGFQDWGLNTANLNNVIQQAYLRDKPFFVPSLGSPYTPFFNAVGRSIPLQFERFELGEGRWIYRLKTHNEIQHERGLPSEPYNGPTVQIVGERGEVNLVTSGLAFSSATMVIQQEMSSFGPGWVMGDQIFFGASNPGSQIDLVVRDKQSTAMRELAITFTTAPDFGDVTVYADDRTIGTFSLYSPRVERTTISLGRLTIPKGGTNITIRTTGKAPGSSGYNTGIDTIRFATAR